MKASAALLAITLAGCATVDRPQLSRFEPLGQEAGVKTFKFTARADPWIYPVDTPAGEGARMQWLESYLAENSFCAKGHEITSRDVVAIEVGLGKVHDVFYRGRCKS